MIIRHANINKDSQHIYQLYKVIARNNPGTINQQERQITRTVVGEWLSAGSQRGILLVAELDDKLIGFLKGFTSPFISLAKVLGEVTILIQPEYQNKKIGNRLVTALQNILQTSMRHILKVQLLPHDTNVASIHLYKKLGFEIMYSSKNKILNPDGTFGDQVLMEWVNPHFDNKIALQYNSYLLQLNPEIKQLTVFQTFQQFMNHCQPKPKL